VAGRTQFTEALLLKAVDYGESDRIVTLLTRDFGKVSALARGARRSRKRFGGALQPCCHLEVELGSGRGELARLAQASIKRAYPRLLGDLRKLRLAGAALEWVREATPMREPEVRIFDAAVHMLEATEAATTAHGELLLSFDARLLALVGFAPGLERCAGCGRRAPPDQAAQFDPKVGAIVCRACGGGPIHLSAGTRRRLAAAGGARWAEQVEPWSEREREQARESLQAVASCSLGRELSIPTLDGS
jgi:DNA repair protein RecO (recombination protein O)